MTRLTFSEIDGLRALQIHHRYETNGFFSAAGNPDGATR
jgi:hypothetical protein